MRLNVFCDLHDDVLNDVSPRQQAICRYDIWNSRRELYDTILDCGHESEKHPSCVHVLLCGGARVTIGLLLRLWW